MNKIIAAADEEFQAMLSGKFIPYHIASFMMAIMITLIVSVCMRHGEVFEGKIAVIDLDCSHLSTTLIEKLNTSAYVEITEVYHSPVAVRDLTAHDKNIGVLYIPKGLEKELKRKDSTFNLGYFADYSNLGQNGQAIANLSDMIAVLGAENAAPEVAALAQSSGEKVKALLQPMNMVKRELYNPTTSASITFCSAFIYFFSTIILGLTSVMLVGRFKVSMRWNAILEDGFACLLARLLPYALIYTTAISLVTSPLIIFGQMRFEGNYFAHLPSIFMTAFSIGVLAMLVTWKTSQPSEGSSRMILIVPPGFILGGSLLASGSMPEWVNTVKFAFPLTWQYEFWRDFSMRGLPLSDMVKSYGQYALYVTVITSLLALIYHKSRNNYFEMKKEEKTEAVNLSE